ncbi:MAG TPA: hypothetical protein PL195_13180 [bacterium]|nr:hypothetical protein [bacterium]
MIVIPKETLVIGIDKWFVENCVKGDFFWFGHPFENSKTKGFISPQKEFSIELPVTLIVDLSEATEADILSFDLGNTIFYSEEWKGDASKVASFIKNIINFKDGVPDIVKKDHQLMQGDLKSC